MNPFFAIVLVDQLDDPDTNYLDLLDIADEVGDLTDDPRWNGAGAHDGVLKSDFDITRLSNINVHDVANNKTVAGAICRFRRL